MLCLLALNLIPVRLHYEKVGGGGGGGSRALQDPLNCATAQLTYLCNLSLQLQNLCHLFFRVISSSEQLSYFGHEFQISQPRLKQNAKASFKVHLTPKFFFGRDETVQHSHKEFDNFIGIW